MNKNTHYEAKAGKDGEYILRKKNENEEPNWDL